MRKIRNCIFIILTLIILTPINTNAETYGEILDAYDKAYKEYQENKSAINNSNNQISEDNETISNLKSEITKMSEETTQLQQEITDANTEIEEKEEETKSVVAYLQMSQGDNVYLEYVFGSESITDMVYRLAVVEQLTEYNEQVISDLEELISNNEAKKVELAEKEELYESKIETLNTEISNLNSSISALGELSPGLEQEVKDKKALVDYYKSQGCSNRSDVIGVDCATTSANAYFSKPVKTGYVTSFVGYRWGSLHRGIDIGSSTGKNTAIYSIGNGVITSIWTDSSGALCVNIKYKDINGTYYTAIYAHLSKYASNIYVGKEVTSSTIIGYMGDTGYAYGVHLHLEVWPCRIYEDSNCSTWSKYTSFVSKMYNSGFKGASSVISFPSKTYTTWYTR